MIVSDIVGDPTAETTSVGGGMIRTGVVTPPVACCEDGRSGRSGNGVVDAIIRGVPEQVALRHMNIIDAGTGWA